MHNYSRRNIEMTLFFLSFFFLFFFFFFFFFLYFQEKIKLDTSSELSARQTIHMKRQVLFSMENNINFRMLLATNLL